MLFWSQNVQKAVRLKINKKNLQKENVEEEEQKIACRKCKYRLRLVVLVGNSVTVSSCALTEKFTIPENAEPTRML